MKLYPQGLPLAPAGGAWVGGGAGSCVGLEAGGCVGTGVSVGFGVGLGVGVGAVVGVGASVGVIEAFPAWISCVAVGAKRAVRNDVPAALLIAEHMLQYARRTMREPHTMPNCVRLRADR